MRSFYAFLLVFLAASTAAAQADDPAPVVNVIPGRMPIIAPRPYGFTNSVIDHNGRLWIIDSIYEFPPPLATGIRPAPSRTTSVTVIENDGVTKRTAQFNGTFQVLGVGRYAVYALSTDYPIFTTLAPAQPSMLPSRSLLALGPAFPTLPSVAVPLQAEVKVSAVGDDGAPDTIAFVDVTPSPIVLGPGSATPTAAMPTRLRTVQMFQSDGKSFSRLTPSPIPVP